GRLTRPPGFAPHGSLTAPGPRRVIVFLIAGGAVLVLGGGAYGPIAKRAGRSRARTEPASAG
ncbi:signal peptidase I, partial [Streptomyces sp. NPDC058964]